MSKRIAIIGAGQLGSRHLQGVAGLQRAIDVYVVDPSDSSLQISLERHRQVDLKCIQTLHLLKSVSELPTELDLVIIASTADIRYQVLVELLECANPQHIILEKVLFQDIAHYSRVLELETLRKIDVRVNFAQRMWPYFIELRDKFFNDVNLDIQISGSNWGLGCNSVHNVDLADFLWSREKFTIAKLDASLLQSKRANFVEFSGEVQTTVSGGGSLRQISYATGNSPFVIAVSHPTFRHHWDVSAGILYAANIENGWIFEKQPLIPPFQSHLTTRLVDSIFSGRDCELPTLKDACVPHLITLKALLESCKNGGNDFGNICPIT